MQQLAEDVLAIMDAACIERAAIAGDSLGGMIAMELALLAPARVEGLGLVSTTATSYAQMWGDRIAKVRAEGIGSIADMVMTRFLSPGFIEAHPEYAETIRRTFTSTDSEGYAGCGAAIRDMDLLGRLPQIQAPTVVVVGSKDVSTPLAGNGDKLLALIPDAVLAETEGSHIGPMEDPEGTARALAAHLGG